MKRILLQTAGFLFFMTVIYIFGVFVTFDEKYIDIRNWEDFFRFLMILVSLLGVHIFCSEPED